MKREVVSCTVLFLLKDVEPTGRERAAQILYGCSTALSVVIKRIFSCFAYHTSL